MKQEKIRQVLKDEMDKIAALADDLGRDFDPEVIHKFRVSAKILRSFLRLLALHAPQPHLKVTSRFKRLYHIAGTLRDTQLEYDNMRKRAVVLPDYINTLRNIVSTQKKEWAKHYSKKTVRKMEEKLLALRYEKLHPAVLDNFFNSRTAAIARISDAESPSDDQLHSARKAAKDIMYAARISEKHWKGAAKKLKVLPTDTLNSFADASGSYNDHRNTLAHICTYSNGATPKEKLDSIITAESKKLEKQKKSVISMARELVNAMQKRQTP